MTQVLTGPATDPSPTRLDLAGRVVWDPFVVAAVVLLIVNDNLLKGSSDWFPPTLAGKLSDIAGLFFFPALLLALTTFALGRMSRPVLWAGALATAVFFTAIQTHDGVADVYVASLSWLRIPVEALRGLLTDGVFRWEQPVLRHVMDSTDLLTLPAVLAGAWHTDRRLW